MRWAVLGPGGVGGFLAAALTRADAEVTVVAREATAAVLAQEGLRVRSVRLGDFTARPAAVSNLVGEPVDVLVVATKATTLDAALTRVQTAPRLVVPLLNGLDHIGRLRAHFGADRVAAASIRIESDRPEPAVVVQTSPFLRIDLAADDPAVRERLLPVAAALERAEIPVAVGMVEAQIMWSKLVRLCALACTTSVYERPIGEIRADPKRRAVLVACLAEAAAVAGAAGAVIDPAERLAELDDAHPGLGSSMWRDLQAGRAPELDAIAGAVVRAGARHGVATPMVARLAGEIATRYGVAFVPWGAVDG